MKKILLLAIISFFASASFAQQQAQISQLDPYSWQGWKMVRNGLPIQATACDRTIGYVFTCPVYRDRAGEIHTPANDNPNPYEPVYLQVYVAASDGTIYPVSAQIRNASTGAREWESVCVKRQNVSLQTRDNGYIAFYNDPMAVRVARVIDRNGQAHYYCDLM